MVTVAFLLAAAAFAGYAVLIGIALADSHSKPKGRKR